MARKVAPALAICILFWTSAFGGAQESGVAVRRGDPFPDMVLQGLIAPEDYAELGLTAREGQVRLSDIPGDLLILDFFNRFCVSCQRQAVSLQAYRQAVRGTDLDSRVRILGVGSGNSATALRQFRSEQRVSFPMGMDPTFELYYSLGDPEGMPLTLFLAKQVGKWVLVDTHLGTQGDLELLARTRVLLEGKQGDFTKYASRQQGSRVTRYELTEEEERNAAKAVLAKAAGREIGVRLRTGDGGRKVFEALDAEGKPLGLYAMTAQRQPICDLCHTILFSLAFDREGVVRAFVPLYVTKFGNEAWNEADMDKQSSRLVGRSGPDLIFNPEVDAVTSATLSSTLIFDEARKSGEFVRRLAKEN